MQALVTGGVGFVGTNLIKRLLKDGHDVTSFDNYSTGFKKNEQQGCRYVNVDVSKSLIDGGEFDIIFHMAALARIQPSIKNPKDTIKNNFDSTLNVLEYARKHGNIPVVYAGSSSYHHGLYGSPYAWSKYGGEELCKLYGEVYDLNTIICRFYNVYGPHHIRTGNYATVLGIFEQQYLDNKPLTITGTGEQRRDFTHVDDIVDGLVRCMRAMHGEVDMRFAGEIYELGSGKNYSINEIANFFETDTTYIPSRPGEYDVTLCDYSKAKNELGWKPTKNVEGYLKGWLKKTLD
tara:strand:+ start:8663 stop:9535 length:873 start_codon:yes stop_codon:yes gene_type:complete